MVVIDTSLDSTTGRPLNSTLGTVPLCENPNLLEIYHPEKDGPSLAFVSCYSEDRVAAVDLTSLALARSIDMDDGPNEMIIDYAREKLYVVHTLANTIGVVELNRASIRYLQFVYRFGTI